MDENLYNGIMALCQENKRLANTATSAADYYNKIVDKYFDGKFWRGIARKFIMNTKLTVEPLPVSYTIPSIDINNVDGISRARITTTGTGAAVGIGRTGAIAIALSSVNRALNLYKMMKDDPKDILNRRMIREGIEKLKTLSENLKPIKGYCDHMTNALENAISSLEIAMQKVGQAQKKIESQEYATKDSNLKEIKARRIEIKYLNSCLNDALRLVEITKGNLDLLI